MIQLLVPGMNRIEYLDVTRVSLKEHLPEMYADRVESHDTEGLGMARGIQAAWDAALEREWDYLLHWEEDMECVAAPPLGAAISALDADLQLAQMCFRREPWHGSPPEVRHGCQLAAILEQAANVATHAEYVEHDFIFSLNPCLIPRRIVEMGWPEGPLGIGNESGMTAKLRDAGYRFGSWGQPKDGQVWARHIGESRAAGWKL